MGWGAAGVQMEAESRDLHLDYGRVKVQTQDEPSHRALHTHLTEQEALPPTTVASVQSSSTVLWQLAGELRSSRSC